MEAEQQVLLDILTEKIRLEFNLEKSSTISCACCKKEPKDIKHLVAVAQMESVTPEEYAKDDGTYSKDLNLFVCDDCFYAQGAPTVSANLIDGEYSRRAGKLTVLELCMKKYNKGGK